MEPASLEHDPDQAINTYFIFYETGSVLLNYPMINGPHKCLIICLYYRKANNRPYDIYSMLFYD